MIPNQRKGCIIASFKRTIRFLLHPHMTFGCMFLDFRRHPFLTESAVANLKPEPLMHIFVVSDDPAQVGSFYRSSFSSCRRVTYFCGPLSS
jgi:hypothetical protein